MATRDRDRNRRMLEWSEENAERLLKLRPSQQNEALRRVYLDGKRAGNEYLRAHETARSEASRKSAVTREVNRRMTARRRIKSAMSDERNFSEKEFNKSFLHAKLKDIRDLERMTDADLKGWVKYKAEMDSYVKKPSYAFYHGAK